MKLNRFGKRIIGGLFTLSLLLAIGVATNQTANAQYPNDPYRREGNNQRHNRGRNWDGYPNWGGSFELRQTALNAGYNEGIKQGRDDAKHRRRNGYERSSAYQKATKDYSSRLGDRELYRRYFREAFPNGYDDGMRGY
jgi:hypothetical protein